MTLIVAPQLRGAIREISVIRGGIHCAWTLRKNEMNRSGYDRAGIKKYNWENYGPEQTGMQWYYHSFDPKEQWAGADDRLGRDVLYG